MGWKVGYGDRQLATESSFRCTTSDMDKEESDTRTSVFS